jgi:uncharacterized membrane protein YhhN
MRRSILFFAFAYFILGLLFMFSTYTSCSLLQFILKASIIPSLIVFFIISRGKMHYAEDKYILGALIFSWIGDILLQIRNGGEMFFLLGLLSFLITHIFYTIVFLSAKGEFLFLKKKQTLIIVIIIYGALTIYTIMPGLGTMQIPVTIYGIIITGMVIAALSRFGNVNDASYLYVFLGAVLFLISDSLIAISRFKQAFPYSELFIMSTYVTGQFMIIRGTIKQYPIEKIN